MQGGTLFVSDIFSSIQGEGPKLGTPSIFLRLGMCNLHCNWCDTPYTWKPDQSDYKRKTQEEIIKKISVLRKAKKISNLVITGGEPLLQQKNLIELLSDDRLSDMEIEIETNGSQKLSPSFKPFKNRLNFNISPKLADSGNRPYKVYIYPRSVLKFVYVSQSSEKLINQFLKENVTDIRKTPILIMPEGTSIKAMSEKYEDVLRYCLKNNFRLTPRLHIYLFGNRRAT